MSIAKFCIKHKVTTLMAVIMISIFGVVFTTQLQLALLPDVEAPAAVVMCYYSGASPQDMEELVSRPLESAVMSVAGVEEVQSVSSEGVSQLQITYADGTDLDIAATKLREQFDQLSLPDGAGDPIIVNINISDLLPSAIIALMGDDLASIQSMAVRAASGSYLPLDEYFEAEGVTPEDAYDIVVRNDEQVYSIFSDIRYNNVILINKDMLEAAGLSMPDQNWTWDDYREYAIAMTQGTGANTIYGSYIHSWGNQNLLGVYCAKPDNAFFNDDGSLTFGNPEFRDFLQFRYDLENVDKASTPLADVKALNMNYRDQFFSGKIAMLPMGTNLLSDVGNEIYAHDFVTAFAPCPLWNVDDTRYNSVGGIYYHIAKTSAHPQEAFEFLRFWTTEGVPLKAMFTSNEKGVDKMESTKAIVAGFEDLVDLDSLEALMENPDGVETYDSFAPEYQSQIETVLNEETDKFLLGSQSLDDTINNLLTRGNEIIEENQ